MIKLNLIAKDKQQELIKNYLEENVTDVIADKINKGTEIIKDGKTYISKKDLDGFMDYACKTAQEQAEKGKHSAMVEDKIVYGWAMHYFEEDSIEGKLFNPDGSPYEPPKPQYQPKPITKPVPPVKDNTQPNFFDLLTDNNDVKVEEDDDEEISEEDTKEAFEELEKEEKTKTPVSPVYEQYVKVQNKYPECIVAIRLGDFYEIFGEDAVNISDKLDLTLTGRDVGMKERIPMIGFPYHVADKYFDKITATGKTVAVIENKDEVDIRQSTMKVDMETGEIIKSLDNTPLQALIKLFGNDMEIEL